MTVEKRISDLTQLTTLEKTTDLIADNNTGITGKVSYESLLTTNNKAELCSVNASSSAGSLILDNNYVSGYYDGMRVSFYCSENLNAGATVNVNGLGVVNLKTDNATNIIDDDVKSGRVYNLIYKSSYFLVVNMDLNDAVRTNTLYSSINNLFTVVYEESTIGSNTIPASTPDLLNVKTRTADTPVKIHLEFKILCGLEMNKNAKLALYDINNNFRRQLSLTSEINRFELGVGEMSANKLYEIKFTAGSASNQRFYQILNPSGIGDLRVPMYNYWGVFNLGVANYTGCTKLYSTFAGETEYTIEQINEESVSKGYGYYNTYSGYGVDITSYLVQEQKDYIDKNYFNSDFSDSAYFSVTERNSGRYVLKEVFLNIFDLNYFIYIGQPNNQTS